MNKPGKNRQQVQLYVDNQGGSKLETVDENGDQDMWKDNLLQDFSDDQRKYIVGELYPMLKQSLLHVSCCQW